MTRAAALVVALLSLGLQPPIEPSIGRAPVPPIVGMKGETDAAHPAEGSRSMEFELWKYAVTQGGLTIVCIVVFFYARRDYTRRGQEDREDKQLLVGLIEKNITAMTSLKDST